MSQRPEQRPSKHEAFVAFLREGWVSLYIDARRPGVRVPEHLKDEARLVLQYGRDMPVPIPDLDVSEAGVRATLSFARVPQETMIPWSAVYVIRCTDGRDVVYQEDIPEDLLALAAGATAEAEAAKAGEASVAADAPAEAAQAPARILRSVPADVDPVTDDDDASTKPARRRRPTLRIVK